MTCSILTTLLPCCCARSFASANTKQINSFRNSCAEQRTGVWALLAELRESRGEEGWPPRRRQRGGGLGTVMAEVASRAILLLSGSSFFMMRMMFCLGSLHSSSLPSASAPSPSVSSSAGTWGRQRWLPQRCWRCEASSPLLAAAPFGRGAPLPPPSPPPRHGDAVAHLARHTAR